MYDTIGDVTGIYNQERNSYSCCVRLDFRKKYENIQAG